jgi:hypothetical protein
MIMDIEAGAGAVTGAVATAATAGKLFSYQCIPYEGYMVRFQDLQHGLFG